MTSTTHSWVVYLFVKPLGRILWVLNKRLPAHLPLSLSAFFYYLLLYHKISDKTYIQSYYNNLVIFVTHKKKRWWWSSISVLLYKQNIMIRTFIAFYFTNVSNWQGISSLWIVLWYKKKKKLNMRKILTHPSYIIKWTPKYEHST